MNTLLKCALKPANGCILWSCSNTWQSMHVLFGDHVSQQNSEISWKWYSSEQFGLSLATYWILRFLPSHNISLLADRCDRQMRQLFTDMHSPSYCPTPFPGQMVLFNVESAIHTLHNHKNYRVPFARTSRFNNYNKLAPYRTGGRLLLTANFKVTWHKN